MFKILRTSRSRLDRTAARKENKESRMPSTELLTDESCLDFSLVDAYTVPISDSAALRIYSDTRPHTWKIADLQKGLILVRDGKEVVGEGTGFGLPILVCSPETYFSGTSKVFVAQNGEGWVIRKEYTMDKTSRNKFRNVALENREARSFFAHLAYLYQRHSKFRFLTLKRVTRKIDIDTTFVKTIPAGTVTVTYSIDKRQISVKADFKHLKTVKPERIFMLNEQGATIFRKYVDSQNTILTDGKIGAWDDIGAEWASLTVTGEDFGFRLWKKDDSVLRRGREFLEDSLDWVGLDYETNPKNTAFEYSIEILA